MDVGGVDYLPRTPRFEVVYHFVAVPRLWRLRLRVPVEESAPRGATGRDLWPSAEPAEREVWDLFGIRFTDHPNLTRILLPDDWVGPSAAQRLPAPGRAGRARRERRRTATATMRRSGRATCRARTGLPRPAQEGGD